MIGEVSAVDLAVGDAIREGPPPWPRVLTPPVVTDRYVTATTSCGFRRWRRDDTLTVARRRPEHESTLEKALVGDVAALRRVGVSVRVPRWRRVQRRVMPRRWRRWAEREFLRVALDEWGR